MNEKDKNIMDEEKKKVNRNFFVLLAIFATASVLRYYDHFIVSVNTTAFAFSYKYGFISRGLLGTALRIFDILLPYDFMTYDGVGLVSKAATCFFFLIHFLFSGSCLKRCREEMRQNTRYIIFFLSIFTFPMFVSAENFGRLDVYLLTIVLLCCMLVLSEKGEWLIVPLSIVAMLLHPGYVFMDINLLLVVLLYKILTQRGGKRKKYVALFMVTFVAVSILFLYFEFFSHPHGENIYEEVVATAKSLSDNGQNYHDHLINHDILGEDVFWAEWDWHVVNFIEFPIFLMLFSPYIYIIGKFYHNLIKREQNRERKAAYILIVLGAVTLLPEMILKTDYGRYMFALIFYYIACILMLLAMGDEGVAAQVKKIMDYLKNHMVLTLFLLMYAFMFVPFRDFHISDMLEEFYDKIIIYLPYRAL